MNKAPQSPNEEKNILNRSAVYTVSLYFRMFFRLLGGILIAKFLGPASYGLRNAFDLALEYESYSDLGTFAAMNRTVPYYRGGQDERKADQIEASVFSVNFLYALIIGIILVLTSFYLRTTDWDQRYVDFIFFLGLVIISTKVKEFYLTKLKLEKEFYLLSRAEMLYGFLGTGISVALVYYLNLRGLFIALFISDVITIGYILKKIKRIPAFNVSLQVFWGMLKIGLPMMVVFLLLTVLRSADRVLVLALLSEEALGFFGIATVAIGVIGTVPSAINSVTLPPLMEKLGRTKDIHRIKNYLTEPTVLIAYFLPFLLAVLYLTIHLPIEYFLTQYLPAISVVKILTLGLFFGAIASPPQSVSFALNKQTSIIFVALPAVILNFALNYSFISFGWGLQGVAFGTGLTYFVFGSTMIWYTFRQFKVKTGEILRFLSLIYAPFLYTLILLLSLDNFSPLAPFGFWNDVVMTSIKLSLFFLLYAFVFVLVRRHSAIVKLVDNLPMLHSAQVRLRKRFSQR